MSYFTSDNFPENLFPSYSRCFPDFKTHLKTPWVKNYPSFSLFPFVRHRPPCGWRCYRPVPLNSLSASPLAVVAALQNFYKTNLACRRLVADDRAREPRYPRTSEFFSITAGHLFSSRLSKLHLEEDRLSPSSFIFSFHSTCPARLFQRSTVDLRWLRSLDAAAWCRSLRRSHPSEGRYPPQIRLKRQDSRSSSVVDRCERKTSTPVNATFHS